jgi:predicted phosphodiesterase
LKYGVISDIHSNLEALTVALDFLNEVDGIICLGDIVGYGPNPNECCEIIRDRALVVVVGNHDAAIVDKVSRFWFNAVAREAIEWTADQLTEDNLSFLQRLPLVHETPDFLAVHSSLHDPLAFEYITSPSEARPTFTEMGTQQVCLIGHTHVAEYYVQKTGELTVYQVGMAGGGTVEVEPDFKYIINCGSVGQPRDGDPRASVGIFDTDANVVTIHRLDYPIEVTQEKMKAAGLPEPLWKRLEFGW